MGNLFMQDNVLCVNEIPFLAIFIRGSQTQHLLWP